TMFFEVETGNIGGVHIRKKAGKKAGKRPVRNFFPLGKTPGPLPQPPRQASLPALQWRGILSRAGAKQSLT
ncbi:MAG TPA: hypothetical protein PKD17_03355, partial [Cellvibrionaceae bacterium]|nr:hypothetical protein [Cellvibrionaceae bacterium]